MNDQGSVLTAAQQDQVSRDMQQYLADFDALMKVWGEIVKDHDGDWIAFADGKVQATGNSADAVRSQLPKDVQSRAVVQHVQVRAYRCL